MSKTINYEKEIASIDNQMGKLSNRTNALKEQRNQYVKEKEYSELKALNDFLKHSGKSASEILAMIQS